MKDIFAIIAAILAIVGNVPYLRAVWQGKVQPHPFTWFVGTLISVTVFFGMWVKGAGIAVLPVAASELFTVIIFLSSIKYGFTHVTKIDYVFLVAALLGFVPWIITKDPTLSVMIAVSIDVLSLMPTYRKTWKKPFTEHPILYGSNVLRHLLVLSSLQAYNVATMLHSIAMICANTVLTVIILVRRYRNNIVT